MTLVLHGLQAIAIHRERVGVRIIIFSLGSIILLLWAILTVVVIRMFTELAIPGWASNLVGIFTILLIQIIGLSLFFIFLVLGAYLAISLFAIPIAFWTGVVLVIIGIGMIFIATVLH